MRRGSVELSLNALIMFILSVMVLGAGIYLVSVFLDLGTNAIETPDRCDRDLTTNNEQFVICPQTVPEKGTFSSRKSYEVRYEFFNLVDNTHTNYAIGIHDPDNKFIVDKVPLQDVNRGEAKRGVFLIRRNSGGLSLDASSESIRVFICPEDTTTAGEPDCDATGPYGSSADPAISRVLTINTD